MVQDLPAYLAGQMIEMHRSGKKMKRDVEKTPGAGEDQAQFEASIVKLRPLLARIAAIDRLIDLIVCRLYGLAEEEIAVVEGLDHE